MARVYLETSFVSYLAAWPSRDLIVASHQQITHEWWRRRRASFELYISQRVIDEAGAGDEEAAQRRLALLEALPLLDLNEEVVRLAEELVAQGPFVEAASADAVHVAVAAVHAMDFLLTWNCRHIANAETVRMTSAICSDKGYSIPYICTPEELLGA
jgi:predicted nucleic acid-binding protein